MEYKRIYKVSLIKKDCAPTRCNRAGAGRTLISLMIVFTLFANRTNGQQWDFSIVSGKNINDTILRRTSSVEERIIYLGDICDENDDVLYHIVSVFTIVSSSRINHGHSNLIYLDSNFLIVAKYELGLPEELPYLLYDNKLYFKYKGKSGIQDIFINDVGLVPPKVMCVCPTNCY